RRASAASGARLVDVAAHPVGSDRRLWSEDRFHVNAEGHARIAAALGEALGFPGDEAWSRPLPPDPRSALARGWDDLRWIGRHLLPFARGGGRGAPRGPKRPRLTPV
ncbi:MAG TPA: SGNH/GDSL hydrolase family protein, partial [Planctomycetota bacterium]|nr:SGNH/GDSL hydrolase family protein [Planctomycetota bacterium]